MAQKRTHDYRGPRSSENLNGHFVGVVPHGVYEGFQVASDGSVSPGMLITPEGIRIEETEAFSVPQPVADPIHARIDLVVCIHEYEKTVPAPPAQFTTVPGEPAAAPTPPDIPEHAIVLAACRMEAGAAEWTDIMSLGYPVRVYNAVQQLDFSWKIVLGARGAMMQLFDPNTGTAAAFVVAPDTLSDGDPIEWGAPVLEYDADGILQVQSVQANLDQEVSDREAADNALDNTKLDKAGGTISGDLILEGKLTLDANDVADIAFDDWVEFTRWVQPCQGNSSGWDNLGYTWKSADGLATLYVPIHAIVGAELVSVDIGVTSAATGALNVYFGFTTADFSDSIVSGRVEFGDIMVEVAAGETRVTNVPLLDPDAPHDPRPFPFDSTHTLWLRIKAQDDVDQLYEKTWKPFDDDPSFWRAEVTQGRLKRPRIDLFLFHYLTLMTRDDVLVGQLFVAFKKWVQDTTEWTTSIHLEKLAEYAKIYRRFAEYPADSREGLFFYRLDLLDTTTLYPCLLEVFREFARPERKSELHQVLGDLESFLVRRMVCKLTTKNYNRLFLDLITVTSKAEKVTADDIRTFLLAHGTCQQKWDSFTDFGRLLKPTQMHSGLILPIHWLMTSRSKSMTGSMVTTFLGWSRAWNCLYRSVGGGAFETRL